MRAVEEVFDITTPVIPVLAIKDIQSILQSLDSPLDARKLARAPPAGPAPTMTHSVEKSGCNFGLSAEDIFVETRKFRDNSVVDVERRGFFFIWTDYDFSKGKPWF